MDQSLCKLTLVYPLAAEDVIIELLLASEPVLHGFTSWNADGHGMGFHNVSAGERVRGRVRRKVLALIATRERAAALLQEIAEKLAIPHLSYWIEPVLEMGRLAEQPATGAATPSKPKPEPALADSKERSH